VNRVTAFVSISLIVVAPALRAQESYGTIKATVKIVPGVGETTTIKDPEKHTSEETVRDPGKRILKRTVYLLDERDQAASAIFYDGKGQILYKATYQRDEAGRVVEVAFASADDRFLGKRTFAYDAKNVATQVTDYDANGQMIVPVEMAAEKPKKKR